MNGVKWVLFLKWALDIKSTASLYMVVGNTEHLFSIFVEMGVNQVDPHQDLGDRVYRSETTPDSGLGH